MDKASMRTNSESRWVTEQLKTNRDFSAGWNSALWEVFKLVTDKGSRYAEHPEYLPVDIGGMVNHIDG